MPTPGFTDKFLRIGAMRFHYLDWGNPHLPDMLLLHGGAQTAHSWDEFSRAMRDRYHIIAPDQRGHGDSDWSKTATYTETAQSRDIVHLVEKLRLKKKFVLVGLSMGGSHSYIYAARHPDRVHRLVVVDVGPEIMRVGADKIKRFASQADILPSFEAFIERAHKFNPRRPLEQLRERLKWSLRELPDGRWSWKYDYRRWKKQIAPGYERKGVDRWENIKRITAPTLLVRGMESDILSPEVARKAQAVMKDCTLVEIPKAGHTVPGDNPVAFAKAVRDWLASRE